MNKTNKYIFYGLILNSIFLLGNDLNLLPEFIKELYIGLGTTLILVGSYLQKHDLSKLRNYKKLYLIKYYQNSICDKYLKYIN